MKKLALGILSLFLLVGTINAQEGKKALKEGEKILKKFGANAIENAGNLSEGVDLIMKAMENSEVAAEAKNYNKAGAALNAAAGGQINAKFLDETYNFPNPDLSLKAMEMFQKALSMAEKKGDKKDALNGLSEAENHINNFGIYLFQGGNYADAFNYFNSAITIYKTLKENGEKSRLDDEVERKDHYFYTGAAGYYGQKGMEAAPILEELAADGTDKALVYEALYNVYAESDKTKAEEYLTKGREAFPDDTGLLFSEINYYLTEGRLDDLIGKLELAIEKEPDNVTIYNTLANVYDQLNQQFREKGDDAKADEYFAQAKKYYEIASEKDPTNFDSQYSQGALYYNKAASMTDKINELANDFTPAGTKKYDALKAEMDGYFKEALPYFKKAEELNEKDLNTLIALREIYARTNQMDKVSAYKTKIDAISTQN